MSEAGAARSTRSVVAVLGTTQTIAWASSYYLPAVLADPIARDIGVSPGLVFAAFSLALLASGVLGGLAMLQKGPPLFLFGLGAYIVWWRHRRLRHALLHFLPMLAVALVAAAAIVPPIGARRAARLAAEQEVMAQLAPNERILARTFASQRRWTDMGRESFGVVVATGEQLLFVSAPPTPMLRPREDGPAEMLVERYPYAAVLTIEPRTRFGGYQRSLVLRTPTTTVHFNVEGRDWTSALRVLQVSDAAR